MSEADGAEGRGRTYDIAQILNALPHRYPLLLVDKVVDLRVDEEIHALKAVSFNEQFFQGHFPNHPIMPGVLQLEAMAQVAGFLMLKTVAPGNQVAYFMAAENVKWRKPVLPGDTLIIEAELLKLKRSVAQARGRCSVNGAVVSEADLMFSLIDR